MAYLVESLGHLRVHSLVLHREQEHPQAVLAVVPETAERDHAEVAMSVYEAWDHDSALRVDLLEDLASLLRSPAQ